MKEIKMKFKDAPIGTRFNIVTDKNEPKNIYVKLHPYGDGLIARWTGNVEGQQIVCSWVDEVYGVDFDTEILAI